jgi:hypothetical protein
VIYPFLQTDTNDVHGSVGATPISAYRLYKTNSASIDPNPANGFTGATSGNFAIYTYAATPSTSNWSFTQTGNTFLAHMKTTNLTGGGTGFFATGPALDLDDPVAINAGIYVYPNPAKDQWFISLSANNKDMSFQLFTTDGKLMISKTLQGGAINVISASGMPTAVYYYRIISDSNVYTGTLLKE